MPKCPYSACRNHRFRNEKAVNAHLKSHDEPLPFTSFITTSQTVATDASTYQEQDEMFSSNEQYEYDDYSAYMSDDQSPSLESNNNNHQNALNKSTVISAVNIENNNEKSNNGNGLKLNEIELRFARASLSAGLSKAKHTEFANILQDAADLVHNTGNPLKISTCTLDGLFTKIDAECRDKQVPFYEHEFDISSVHGIPSDCIQDFRDSYGIIKLVYRDINKLCELLFSYENFWKDTVLLPEIWKRDGQRVVQDTFTAKWWHELQSKLPVGAIVLALMLSSDETVQRWSSIKCCIIHHCLRVILAPFANRAPYRRLMAGVKSGMSMYACPRCWTVTTKFHLPYYNTKL
ncbi:hypothetical protein BDC45DRAFT_542724 [Circinella umbellata]|nr:hypothetical protein BDC45DRAFT_542724 [Circinella umbellata]